MHCAGIHKRIIHCAGIHKRLVHCAGIHKRLGVQLEPYRGWVINAW